MSLMGFLLACAGRQAWAEEIVVDGTIESVDIPGRVLKA